MGLLGTKIEINPMKMKYKTVLLLGLGMTLGLGIAKAENPASDSVAEEAKQSTATETAEYHYIPSEENLQAREHFRDQKFGIFLHWGLYSMLAQALTALGHMSSVTGYAFATTSYI